MEKRTKESRKRLNSLILLIAFTAILLIVSTYAWFTTQKDVSITNLKGTVEVAESLEISLDGKNWAQHFELSESNLATALTDLTGITGSLVKTEFSYPDELKPVSSCGDINGANVIFYSGEFSGTKLKDIAAETKGLGASGVEERGGKLIAFDVYLRNSSRDNNDDVLQLDSIAAASVLTSNSATFTRTGGRNGTFTNDTYVGNAESGLQNTVRVAFGLYGTVADSTATQEEIAKTNFGDLSSVAIWEPNSSSHSDYFNTNIKKLWTATGCVHATWADQHTTYAISKDAYDGLTTKEIANVYKYNTSSQTALQTTVGSDGNNALVAEGVQNLKTTSGTDFTIKTNKVSKVRIYAWLEGQDVDCSNYASLGGGIELNIALCKDATPNTFERATDKYGITDNNVNTLTQGNLVFENSLSTEF